MEDDDDDDDIYICIYVCVCVCISMYKNICLFVCLLACLSMYLPVYDPHLLALSKSVWHLNCLNLHLTTLTPSKYVTFVTDE